MCRSSSERSRRFLSARAPARQEEHRTQNTEIAHHNLFSVRPEGTRFFVLVAEYLVVNQESGTDRQHLVLGSRNHEVLGQGGLHSWSSSTISLSCDGGDGSCCSARSWQVSPATGSRRGSRVSTSRAPAIWSGRCS